MEKEYKDIDAVHSDDLDHLLDKLGLLNDYKSGQIKCKFCRNPITEDNIYSVIKDSGSYKLVCDRADCVKALMQFVASRKKKV
jgi:hypothetical protein